MRQKIVLATIGLLASSAVIAFALHPVGQVLLFGWFAFIRRNFTQATLEPAAIATGVFFLLLLIAVIELFARSLMRSIPHASSATLRRWRFRWTLSIVSALFLMFVVGYSTIGLARHIGWVITSKEPNYREMIKWEPAEDDSPG